MSSIPYHVMIACFGAYCGLALQREQYAYAAMFAVGAIGWMAAFLWMRLYEASKRR
jgi:predicted MFS family arabinose efflux permease